MGKDDKQNKDFRFNKDLRMMNKDEKMKALDAALSQIEKAYGKGSVMKLGDTAAHMNVETMPTGSLSLDIALGLGGLPKGRVIEVYGPESSGKTTVALHMVAEAQKRGGIAGFIDAEHALDPVYAKAIGVDIDNLYISQPDSGEQGLEITETMVRSGAVDIIIVDSVAALVPKAEIQGDMGDSHVGLQARLMSQALRKLTAVISKSNCIVIFINQLREKVGVSYGSPEVTTGGRALKFYASIRLDVRKTETLKQGGDMIGNRVKVKVVKNKIAPPFKEAEFDIMFGKGISTEGDILDLAAKEDIVDKSGAWYSYQGTRIGQGRENAKIYLQDHPDMCLEIEDKVREQFGLGSKDGKGQGQAEEAGKLADAKAPAKKAAGRPKKGPGSEKTGGQQADGGLAAQEALDGEGEEAAQGLEGGLGQGQAEWEGPGRSAGEPDPYLEEPYDDLDPSVEPMPDYDAMP